MCRLKIRILSIVGRVQPPGTRKKVVNNVLEISYLSFSIYIIHKSWLY